MRRLILVVAGLLAAFVAGMLVLTAGLAFEAVALPQRTALVMVEIAGLLIDALGARTAVRLADLTLAALWRAVLTLCLAPICLVAVTLEVAYRRSIGVYAGATGALTAAMPFLLQPAQGPGLPDGRLALLLFLSGLASGAAYGLVAAETG